MLQISDFINMDLWREWEESFIDGGTIGIRITFP